MLDEIGQLCRWVPHSKRSEGWDSAVSQVA